MEDAEIMTVGAKGQIVIPEDIRKQLAIKPKTKLAVYRKDDKLIVTKLSLPVVSAELDSLPKRAGRQKDRSKKAP